MVKPKNFPADTNDMARYSESRRIVGLVLLMAALFLSTGCNEAPTDSRRFDNYRIEGGLVVNLETDSSVAVVRLWRSDTVLTTATIALETDTLMYADSGFGADSIYALFGDTIAALLGELHMLEIHDSANFSDTVGLAVPDSFSILSVFPFNRLIQGNDNVTMEWSGPDNAEAFMLASTPVDSAFTGWGYSILSTTLTTAGTIPSDAFVLTDGINPDTGLYNLYVYAISGSPDSALTASLLPAPMSRELSDNIAATSISGRFGVVVISRTDTVRVAIQP